jgi:anti-sigma factor RsiW
MTDSEHPAGHLLQAYHDGELDAASAADVATHCERCADCRHELADLELVGAMLASARAPELPRTVWHRVRPGRKARESRLKPSLAIAAGAASVVLGVLLGPIQFAEEETGTELAWSETVTVWSDDATAPLLSIYDSELE